MVLDLFMYMYVWREGGRGGKVGERREGRGEEGGEGRGGRVGERREGRGEEGSCTCTVVTGSNPVRGSSVFFFTVCLRTMPCLVLPSFAYSCTRFDRVLRLYVCLLEVA